jgi:hypothetical protein
MAIGVKAPRLLSFAQAVNEDRHLRGRAGEGDFERVAARYNVGSGVSDSHLDRQWTALVS